MTESLISITPHELDNLEAMARRDDCLDELVPSDIRRLVAEIRRLHATRSTPDRALAAISRWSKADKAVNDLPEECYLTTDGITALCAALRGRTEAEQELHRLTINADEVDNLDNNA